ncbi:MAG TPA: DUF3024 domain-containing protein [Streptosporangiaceae bacterium]|nr:DUF3024 domain-containing protein [Streptosporangiaceae bacterium]
MPLTWRARNLHFHIYDLIAPTSRINDLLDEIDRDPTCIFRGYPETATKPKTSRSTRANYRRQSGSIST